MKTYQFLLVAILAFFTTSSNAFVANKKKSTDRRGAFTANSNNKSEDHIHNQVQQVTAATSTMNPVSSTMVALPPTAMATTLSASYYDDYEEDSTEDDVSYGVALVSCVLSLAVGFGTGYLV